MNKKFSINKLLGSVFNSKSLGRLFSPPPKGSNPMSVLENEQIYETFSVEQLEVLFNYYFQNGYMPRVKGYSLKDLEEKVLNSSYADLEYIMLRFNLFALIKVGKKKVDCSQYKDIEGQFYGMLDDFHFDNLSLRKKVEGLREFYEKNKSHFRFLAKKANLFEHSSSIDQSLVVNRILIMKFGKPISYKTVIAQTTPSYPFVTV